MKMAKLIVLLTCVVLWATAAYAQKASLATDTQHGAVGAQVCNGCHTPHAGTNANAYLWNKNIAAVSTSYATYTSPTMGNATAAIVSPGNGNLVPGNPESNTLLCLSCHDGAIAAAQTPAIVLKTATYGTVGDAITGTRMNIGNTLVNDHPVNMAHNPANDAGLQIAATVTGAGGLRLYTGGAATNTVQCGSCHDPHKQGPQGGAGVGYYLRKTQAAGALCLTCHL